MHPASYATLALAPSIVVVARHYDIPFIIQLHTILLRSLREFESQHSPIFQPSTQRTPVQHAAFFHTLPLRISLLNLWDLESYPSFAYVVPVSWDAKFDFFRI